MSSITLRFPKSLSVHSSKLQELERAFIRQGFDTQENFAEAIELHVDTIRKFRQGKTISRRNFQTICEALELDWEDWAFQDEEYAAEEGLPPQDLEDVATAEPTASDEEMKEATAANEKQEAPQKTGDTNVTQTAHINNGFMIGNVAGDLNAPSSQGG